MKIFSQHLLHFHCESGIINNENIFIKRKPSGNEDKKGYDRFITKIYEKYQSISRFSGTVKLNCLNDDEAYALSRLFGENYNSGDDIKISIKQFLKIMDKSKFKDFDIATFITEYLNVSLLTNKELKSNLIMAEDNFYQEVI